MGDNSPRVELQWDKVVEIKHLKLFFDADFDNSLESILMTHPKAITNFMVQGYSIFDGVQHII